MPFESLSHRAKFQVPDFPDGWLPLMYLYDPDLPLFPFSYFHVLPDNWRALGRPSYTDRAFGYVESVSRGPSGYEVNVVCNKNLDAPANHRFKEAVLAEVRHRLGLGDPVRLGDITSAFSGKLADRNKVLIELWHRVVGSSYGGMLPFGRLWDPVLGLARFVASWRPPQGRKSELIMTHYFALAFGEQIQSGGSIPPKDFRLLPTYAEFTDPANPLNLFPLFQRVCQVSDWLADNHAHRESVGSQDYSFFDNPFPGRLQKDGLFSLFESLAPANLAAALECFNAFDKGAPRTIVFLLLAADLRSGRVVPERLDASDCAAMYRNLGGSYQSPKTIQIYSQQAHGNTAALPRDTWVETFFIWPLAAPLEGTGIVDAFANSSQLGKVERLIWIAAQARKVHSSACDDTLWCLKYGAEGNKEPRGANPFSCRVCLESVRNACPAYAVIAPQEMVFNRPGTSQQFRVDTSAGDNTTLNQRFNKCEGTSLGVPVVDTYSPVDERDTLAFYPKPGHSGEPLTVSEFISRY